MKDKHTKINRPLDHETEKIFVGGQSEDDRIEISSQVGIDENGHYILPDTEGCILAGPPDEVMVEYGKPIPDPEVKEDGNEPYPFPFTLPKSTDSPS